MDELSTMFISPAIIFSIRFSISFDSFSPLGINIFIPLSKKSLCEALITSPKESLTDLVRYATPGVGIGPKSFTSTPADINPA